MTDFKSRYRVDEVPWYWWLPLQIYGWLVGSLVYSYSAFVSLTSRITYQGFALDPDSNYIYCYWHRQVFTYNCLSPRYHQLSFFVHPLWYMRPTHVCGILKGARNLVLGSSGHRGREAASELVGYLRQGDNTFFTPDGPYGPVGAVQKGALHISMQSNTPVVGIRIRPSRYISLNGWDRKQIPLPFSCIVIDVAEPFVPDAEKLDSAVLRLTADMNGNE